jgi:hypothetical protein
VDPDSGSIVALFNPRTDAWDDHFRLERAVVVGRTEVGRATLRLLQMNTEERTEMRTQLLALASGEL